MDFKIIWSEAVISDLREICSYIGADNLDAALRLGEGILDHARILASFPFIGPTHPRGVNGSLREIVFRPYRIFSDVNEESRAVEILHVWHGAREAPRF